MTFLVPRLVRKTADTTRSSTAIIAADPDLVIPLVAGIPYEIDMSLRFETTGAMPGFRVRIFMENPDLDLANSSYADVLLWDDAANVLTQDLEQWGFFSDINAAVGAAVKHHLKISGILKANVTQNYSLGWCQEVSDAANTILKARSYILAKPLR